MIAGLRELGFIVGTNVFFVCHSLAARLAVMLASLAEMSYSYVQVSIQLIRR